MLLGLECLSGVDPIIRQRDRNHRDVLGYFRRITSQTLQETRITRPRSHYIHLITLNTDSQGSYVKPGVLNFRHALVVVKKRIELRSKCASYSANISPLLTGVLCSRLQRATIPDAVRIQFVLLKMGILMLETCRG
jgi:hypothetical protein